MAWLADSIAGLTSEMNGLGGNIKPTTFSAVNKAMTTLQPMDFLSAGASQTMPSMPTMSTGTTPRMPAMSEFFAGGNNDQKMGISDFMAKDMGDEYASGFGQQDQMKDAYFGELGDAGGAWEMLDTHNAEISAAAAKFQVPPNLLKSMINRESSGDWNANNWVNYGLRDQRMLPFVGIFEDAAKSWGINFDQMIGNKQAQIDGMAKILRGLSDQYGGFENAAYVYFGGEDALNGGFQDEFGMDSNTYGQKAIDGWKYLDGIGGGGSYPKVPQSLFGGNRAVDAAMEYLGSDYVWGGIPGKGDPGGNWDCSGLVYWMDQNYGDGSVPMGSHYQYQWAQNTGRLTYDTSQLKEGDLLFFDTGNRAGAGAELNNAGHVGVYIGNGKMLHAANPDDGTIISDLAAYQNMYTFLGGASTSFSGGGSGGGGSMDPMSWFKSPKGPLWFEGNSRW